MVTFGQKGVKYHKLKNLWKKIGVNKKNLGQKIGLKNFSRKIMKKLE